MTFKPNLSVKEGLDHLAKQLDPIIANRLAADLGGHPWTVVLEILDQKKGFTIGYQYWTHDLQAQLRMTLVTHRAPSRTVRLGQFAGVRDRLPKRWVTTPTTLGGCSCVYHGPSPRRRRLPMPATSLPFRT